MVESGKTDVRDFLNGFTVYIWEVITIGFILWIPTWALATSLASLPNGALIFFLIRLCLYIILNAVPELIYQSRASGLELIGASYNFIVENWLEWLIPNIIFALGGMTFRGFLFAELNGTTRRSRIYRYRARAD